MKIFISYPRVLQHFCMMVSGLLEAYEVWIDQRLYAGQQWWPEILFRIEDCHVMLFLVSGDSLKSYYCMEEIRTAARQSKLVIPILCEPVSPIPQEISQYQMVDLSQGLTVTAVRELMNALVIAERNVRPPFTDTNNYSSPRSGRATGTAVLDETQPVNGSVLFPRFNADTFITEVVKAMEAGHYDHAVLLMEIATNRRITFAGFNLDEMLTHAKERLGQLEYRISRESEYRGIGAMINSKDGKVRERGANMFNRFRQVYPDHDPLNLSALCLPLILPEISWCPVRAGEVTLRYPERNKSVTYGVSAFSISKYPITNAQFQIFVDAPDGYRDPRWWDFSTEARKWREKHSVPLPARSPFGDHARVNISFYDANALACWLSYKTGWRIMLPTEQQWQRAAQGDDNRQYPWGPRYIHNFANDQDARIRTTSAVGRFEKGVSPFGVMDMAGNVWEYCRTWGLSANNQTRPEVVAKGGSYLSTNTELRTTSRKHLKPDAYFGTVGFRLVVNFGS